MYIFRDNNHLIISSWRYSWRKTENVFSQWIHDISVPLKSRVSPVQLRPRPLKNAKFNANEFGVLLFKGVTAGGSK
jgi:hypothetical protein